MPKKIYNPPDRNTPRIVEAVEKCGWKWIDTHNLGGGFPDGLAVQEDLDGEVIPWKIIPLEIKNPDTHARGKNKDPFTKDERSFYALYPGLVKVVQTQEDVFRLLGREQNDD